MGNMQLPLVNHDTYCPSVLWRFGHCVLEICGLYMMIDLYNHATQVPKCLGMVDNMQHTEVLLSTIGLFISGTSAFLSVLIIMILLATDDQNDFYQFFKTVNARFGFIYAIASFESAYFFTFFSIQNGQIDLFFSVVTFIRTMVVFAVDVAPKNCFRWILVGIVIFVLADMATIIYQVYATPTRSLVYQSTGTSEPDTWVRMRNACEGNITQQYDPQYFQGTIFEYQNVTGNLTSSCCFWQV